MSKILQYKESLTGYGILAIPKRGGQLCIPPEVGNRHWDAYQLWLAEGNTPDPYRTPKEQKAHDAVMAQQDADQAAENLIKGQLRKQAIDVLKSQGKLPADFKDSKENK